ncbi:MAG TPA: LLM class flavin-dependent oxidoreductase [Acidimicrobiales bacterium]|nr:LLM class flavin-dependent oxidoreductase [Acidimicrobiales bacterium]
MKVRIGVGAGLGTRGDDLGQVAEDLEDLGYDSLWLPEILSAPATDPLTGLAFAAGRVTKLKLGTTIVLPGRNPVRFAKELATLDRLSGGRLLVTAVLGINRPIELGTLGVSESGRGSEVDELLPLLRRLWSEDNVSHTGARWNFQEVTLEPKPLQNPLEVWLGGSAPSALRRAGMLSDGWLPSACTPEQAATGRSEVERHAQEAGRAISPEHFGVSIAYAENPLPPEVVGRLGTPRRPLDPSTIPVGLTALREMLERFIDVGFSKFVVRPVRPPMDWRKELEILGEAVLDLQS